MSHNSAVCKCNIILWAKSGTLASTYERFSGSDMWQYDKNARNKTVHNQYNALTDNARRNTTTTLTRYMNRNPMAVLCGMSTIQYSAGSVHSYTIYCLSPFRHVAVLTFDVLVCRRFDYTLASSGHAHLNWCHTCNFIARFCSATLSCVKGAVCNCACRTLLLCRINMHWPISVHSILATKLHRTEHYYLERSCTTVKELCDTFAILSHDKVARQSCVIKLQVWHRS